MRRHAAAVLLMFLAGCSSPPAARENRPAAAAPVRIVHFYASPPAVERGQAVLLCYGVENAASLRLNPPAAEVSPSPTRCIEVKPGVDTRYTLTATGAGGARATASAEVKVVAGRPPRPAPATAEPEGMIHTFLATASETARGQPVTICYDVRGADSVSLDPAPPQPPEVGKQCVAVRPERTTEYTLTVRGGDQSETRRVTIRVR